MENKTVKSLFSSVTEVGTQRKTKQNHCLVERSTVRIWILAAWSATFTVKLLLFNWPEFVSVVKTIIKTEMFKITVCSVLDTTRSWSLDYQYYHYYHDKILDRLGFLQSETGKITTFLSSFHTVTGKTWWNENFN